MCWILEQSIRKVYDWLLPADVGANYTMASKLRRVTPENGPSAGGNLRGGSRAITNFSGYNLFVSSPDS